MPQPLDSVPPSVTLRDVVVDSDRDLVRHLVTATGFFRTDEIDIAVELVECRLEKGPSSGYDFLFAEDEGAVVGYICFGLIGCTLGSYDVYWIAVAPNHQGRGLGRVLLSAAEERIRQRGGRHIYIETSGRPQYVPTREFYARCGYEIVATLPDFYDDHDAKVVWRKTCSTPNPPAT